MTQQIPDTCDFDGRKWVIEYWEGNTDCIPTSEQLGIETKSPHTANWAGRIDHFLVLRDQLYLFKIEVNLVGSFKEMLPKGARREVLLRYEPWEVYDRDGTRHEIRECREEFFIFDDLVIPFTGELHLSRPCQDDWNLPASAYDGTETDVYGAWLEFVGGKLVHAEQHKEEE